LQSTNIKNQSQLPWIGHVPILGTLFRSAHFQKQETDLVVIVTPHLAKPATPSEALATPLDSKLNGNDVDLFFRGKQEVDKHFVTPYGHILEAGRPRAGSPWRAGLQPLDSVGATMSMSTIGLCVAATR
jgi:pilus assembly protein CpaC